MSDFRSFFVTGIRRFYAENADAIIGQTDATYARVYPDVAFSRKSQNPIDRRLDFSAYFLALIIALDVRGESFDRIREVCLEIKMEYLKPKNPFKAKHKKTVPRLIRTWIGQWLIRKFDKRISVNSNHEGFVANIITDKEKTYGLGYGVDILECGICKLFRKHRYQQYASILCEVDEQTSALAGLKLIRSGTIATGHEKCDFRFQLKKGSVTS